ncbi:lipid-A-disaccharide synthase [Jannaschia aquimarina]|uniref:Lipid-A-disaccharide synthase n=1 Tax=Jannaschia aquimarina TaxID=935700 RepID=A0A0D1EJM9_9RHOB|nr:lipid-A-disaccharide synthase [Jannaschia aquimarina]KIT16005.1 Lipid-A-disaccharide synthase [Jannaschia aquimarina]SNS99874.1 lipid-A-disaccharide synthase [Jannaschia aquimarina]
MNLFLLAGEPSGDRLGAALMDGLHTIAKPRIAGIGGPQMIARGLDSLFPMDRLSVMGLAEVLPRLPELFALRDQAVEAVLDGKPDALITIDSPDFGLRVAAKVRAADPSIRTIHYVAPSVWAWRPGRAAKMARSIDHILALLPFEPPYMEAAGMTCDFVGHPVVAAPRATLAQAEAFRSAHGERLALVLPGSRGGEIARLASIFGEALRQLPDGVRVVVPTLPHLKDRLSEATRNWPGKPLVVAEEDDRRAAFAAADAALAASGTVSLELAANGVPMVIAYDMAWLSRLLLARMLQVDTVTLVNLVSETRAVPEFLGAACKPGPVGEAFSRLLTVPSLRETQREALDLTMDRLGRGGEAPGLRAARSVLAHL